MVEVSYFLTPRETARLTTYRAAVAAGFYTDQCKDKQSNSPDSQQLLENTASNNAAEAQRKLVPADPDTVSGDMKAPDFKPGENCGGC